jgi:predicted RecA/RadA family phage recombinase
MKNYVQKGHVLTFVNGTSADVASGQGVMFGTNLFGVATGDIADGGTGEIAIEGVFRLPKKAADTPAQGAPAYWDPAEGHVTTTSSAMKKIGVFMAALGGGTTECEVRLVPQA